MSDFVMVGTGNYRRAIPINIGATDNVRTPDEETMLGMHKEIERLSAELTACRQEREDERRHSIDAAFKHVDIAKRAEYAEAQLTELQAEYTRAVADIEKTLDFYRVYQHKSPEYLLNVVVPLVREAIASTPPSVKNLLAVLEAAQLHYEEMETAARHTNNFTCRCVVCAAYRTWKDGNEKI